MGADLQVQLPPLAGALTQIGGQVAVVDFLTLEHARAVSRLYNPMWNPDLDLSQRLLAFYHDEFKLHQGEWLLSHTGHEYILDETFRWQDMPSHETQYRHPYDGRRAEEHS